MADSTVLLVIDPLAGVPYLEGRDVMPITRQTSPNAWALAIARNVLWQIRGQWKYDQDRGIPYDQILGKTPDVRFVEESMRRALAGYFTIKRLTAKQTGTDLVVDFVGAVDRVPVSGSIGWLEGSVSVEVVPLGYREHAASVGSPFVIQFSQELSPWNLPSPADFKFVGFSAVPVITGVSVNGQGLFLITNGAPLVQIYGVPHAVIYEPNTTQQLQSVIRSPVGPFRLKIAESAAFDPLSITSAVPFLWCEADQGVTFSGNAIAAGTSPPAVTITGTNAIATPTLKVRITLAGARGVALYQTSYDGVTWSGSATTVASAIVGPFTINFPVGTYATDNTYDANPQTLNDMTAQLNHMSAASGTGPTIAPAAIGGRAAFTIAASKYFTRAVLTGSRAVSGPMTLILVGVSPASPGSVILSGGNSNMRDLRIDSSSYAALVSTVVGNISPVATVSANKAFQIAASWNGASSAGELRQQSLPTVLGTANPGDPATLALTTIGFGAHASSAGTAVGYKLAAIFVVDGLLSPAELTYLREGFAQRYSVN